MNRIAICRCLRVGAIARDQDGKAQVADALTKLHGDDDLLRAACRQAFTVLAESQLEVAGA